MRASPDLERLVLSENHRWCSGPWQAGPWYPGFHCADSSPRARDGHAGVADEGEASRAQQSLPGLRHVERSGCAHSHDLLGFNGRRGGARHDRGGRSIKPGRTDRACHFSHYASAHSPTPPIFLLELIVSFVLNPSSGERWHPREQATSRRARPRRRLVRRRRRDRKSVV